MTKYPGLAKDWNHFRDDLRRRSLIATMSRYALFAGGTVSAVTGNYMIPEMIDAISAATQADVSMVSGAARHLYGQALMDSMASMAQDVDAVLDVIAAPVKSNIEHFQNGTLIEHHKEWLSEVKVLEIPVGEAFVKTWGWAITPNEDAATLTGRYLKPAIGVAAGVAMGAVALRTAGKVALKTLDGVATGLQTVQEFAKDLKTHARSLFKAVRYGVTRGINAALGREMPSDLENPFAQTQDVPPPTRRERLTATLVGAGADSQVAGAIVSEMMDHVERLETRDEDLGAQIERLTASVSDLQRQIEAKPSTEEVEAQFRRAVAALSPAAEEPSSRGPTIH